MAIATEKPQRYGDLPSWSQRYDDLMTPPWLAEAIVSHFRPQFKSGDTFLDPARGVGAFYGALPGPKDWCEVVDGRDFYDYDGRVDWVFTNPPWRDVSGFLEKAISIADDVVFFQEARRLPLTRKRMRLFEAAGFNITEVLCVPTPDEWGKARTGYQLGAVHYSKTARGVLGWLSKLPV